jgi:hypothetical protein
MIERILRNKNSQNLFAFLIGFGLVVILFHRPIPVQRTLAMQPSEIEGKEVKIDGKCYIYRVEDSVCHLDTLK